MYTRKFHNISTDDLFEVGGKGLSLGNMSCENFPVPTGFVITTNTFINFLEDNNLINKIDLILKNIDCLDTLSIMKSSKQIQLLILNSKVSKNICDEIFIEFNLLNTNVVAVRSSAILEDSKVMSWAGQFDSFLNVCEHDLIFNIKKCWASLYTSRALTYCFEQNVLNTRYDFGVVVQVMIQSDVSGVAFSINPITNNFNQLVIDAGYGLGESIVSGQITPDNYIVDKTTFELFEKKISEQQTQIMYSKTEGNFWKSIPIVKQETPKLTDVQIVELSKLVIKLENYHGFACDVEWALKDCVFYILQSRPITTV